jgi:hypothetical protein
MGYSVCPLHRGRFVSYTVDIDRVCSQADSVGLDLTLRRATDRLNRGTDMGILVLKVLGVWSSLAIVTGFAAGAAIKRAEQAAKELFLTCAFAAIEVLQSSRG